MSSSSMSFKPRYINALFTNEAIAYPPPRTPLLQPATLRARTEQGGPETNHCRSRGHTLLEIGRHAHRELEEPELARQFGDELERRPGNVRVAGGRHRHQPDDAASELLQTGHHAGDVTRRAA